jgi:hypothetical protein
VVTIVQKRVFPIVRSAGLRGFLARSDSAA